LLQTPYLEVEDDFTQRRPHEPSLRDIPDDSRRETEEYHHKIGHGEIHDEVVGNCPHAVIPIHRHTHQRVAYQADQKHNCVKSNENPFVCRGKDVVLYHVEIVII
jgi:hypothetical protein